MIDSIRERVEELQALDKAGEAEGIQSQLKSIHEEAVRQQFALDEKARRLQVLREEHAIKHAGKFAAAPAEWSAGTIGRFSSVLRKN